MTLKSTHIVDIFDDIVDSIRTTGSILSIDDNNDNTYTISVSDVQDLRVKSYLGISNTTNFNQDYRIESIDANTFVIKDTSGKANEVTGDFKSKEPFYDYGHLIDIVYKLSVINNKSSDIEKNQKYPLIMLALDLPAEKETDSSLEAIFNNVNILIATITKTEYTSQQRKEINFEPILIPVYTKFIKAIKDSNYFDIINGLLPHTDIERYFWGRESIFGKINIGGTSNPINDKVDAIELDLKELRQIKNINCLIKN